MPLPFTAIFQQIDPGRDDSAGFIEAAAATTTWRRRAEGPRADVLGLLTELRSQRLGGKTKLSDGDLQRYGSSGHSLPLMAICLLWESVWQNVPRQSRASLPGRPKPWPTRAVANTLRGPDDRIRE